jgi:hypothetical protein
MESAAGRPCASDHRVDVRSTERDTPESKFDGLGELAGLNLPPNRVSAPPRSLLSFAEEGQLMGNRLRHDADLCRPRGRRFPSF